MLASNGRPVISTTDLKVEDLKLNLWTNECCLCWRSCWVGEALWGIGKWFLHREPLYLLEDMKGHQPDMKHGYLEYHMSCMSQKEKKTSNKGVTNSAILPCLNSQDQMNNDIVFNQSIEEYLTMSSNARGFLGQ